MKRKITVLVSLFVLSLTACGVWSRHLGEKPIPTPASDEVILNETFDNNVNYWHESNASGSIQIQKGELYLSSVSGESGIGLGWCEGCNPFNDKYFFKAEISLDQPADLVYGIAFGIAIKAYEGFNYYAFLIDQKTQRYVLTKYNFKTGFTDLAKGSYDGIQGYPEKNELGVLFDKGTIQLYINKNMVSRYYDDAPILRGRIGFFIEAPGTNLIADNVIAYKTSP